MTRVERLGARALLDTVLDPGNWQTWDVTPVQVAPPGSPYARELAAAAIRAGTDEALITGQGTLQGRPVAVVVSEFRFLAGSIGRAASERLVLAVERATREGLPLVDAVLPVDALAEVAARALNVLMAPREGLPEVPELPHEKLPETPAWESITRSRRIERPGVRTLLKLGATDVVPMHGTGQGEQDRALLIALARFGGAPCVVLGQDRRHQTLERPLGPAGLREARRGMRLARELKLPLVSIIDMAGAALSREAEEGGIAGEIARCLSELVMLDEPTLCVLLGQGTGGGALALMPADRVICAQHSWLSPLPPEGASAILYSDITHAPELAASQGVRSLDLLRDGIVDRIVAEHPDAADEPAEFCARMTEVLGHELGMLLRADPAKRLSARLARYRRLG